MPLIAALTLILAALCLLGTPPAPPGGPVFVRRTSRLPVPTVN